MKKILMSVALVSFLGATAVMAGTGDDKKKKSKTEKKCDSKKSCCKHGSAKTEKTEEKPK